MGRIASYSTIPGDEVRLANQGQKPRELTDIELVVGVAEERQVLSGSLQPGENGCPIAPILVVPDA